MPRWRTSVRGTILVASTISLVGLDGQAEDAPAGRVEYNRDIRPILAENCFLCHGPDKGTRKAGFRLDVRQDAIDKEAIVPGQPDASDLVARILSDDPQEKMPPPESTKALKPEQKELLRRWVAEGAGYQSHWAYEPIRSPGVPRVVNAAWARSPIDAFVLANLEARKLGPSPEADRRTLIRRASLDLIGLPPTVDEVDAFVQDASPDAFEKVVDRLLGSPHFGERMAVPWLDLVRFADTVGYHGDQNQNVFPFRDYVVEAFNANMPFDRFTTEQVAGDLLPDPSPDQLVASGFNRLNMVTREGGAQPREYLAKYQADRVRTVAITWLGSTMGCAECHDHKFDPFSARDFYRMSAFFADIEQWGVYMDYGYSPNPDLRGYSNDHPFPPEIDVASPHLARRIASIDRQARSTLDAAAARFEADPAALAAIEAWAESTAGRLKAHPDGWEPSTIVGPSPAGAEVAPDGSISLSEKFDGKKSAPIDLAPGPGWVASIRVELLPRADLGGRIARAASVGPIKVSAEIVRQGSTADDRPAPIVIARADADRKKPTFSNGHADIGILGGWVPDPAHLGERQAGVYVLARPIRLGQGDRLRLLVRADAAGSIRFSTSPMSFDDPGRPEVNPSNVDALIAFAGDRGHRRPPPRAVVDGFLVATDFDPALLGSMDRLAADRAECRGGMARMMVSRARPPIETRVLPRGNWQDESGELVEPGVPAFLPQPKVDPDHPARRLDRLDLARWLTSAENPLTARVFVNRTWKQFLGNGLAAVLEDVGAQGEWPSHPELLDWLADDFRRNGWDVKRLVKQVVTSSTYRQSSRLRPELRDLDPSNRWLASQSPRRLDAEFVRDNALAVSGLLDPELGGPSVFPFQPPGYYAALQFPNRDYEPQADGRQHRRGLYSHWQRTFLHPMLANFDAPSREECIANRSVANTPQQALTLLNDPNFVEAARALAASVGPAGADDASKVDTLYRKVLARPARPAEVASLGRFVEARRAENRADLASARRLLSGGGPALPASTTDDQVVDRAAWVEVCRVLLNLHETITRY